jgi:hypothetical protein
VLDLDLLVQAACGLVGPALPGDEELPSVDLERHVLRLHAG